MLLEQLSYTNKWRRIHPGAKLLFATCAVSAASLSSSPLLTLLIAVLVAGAAIVGAGIPVASYLKVASAPLLFLGISGATLAVAIALTDSFPWFAISFPEDQRLAAIKVCSRSLGSVSALLFLAFTTPLNDLISLMRKLHYPSILTDLMTLCFRTLFVFTEVVHDVATAQSSRMGYSTTSNAMKSMGILIAALMVQVWRRSQMLHQSALSRANDGPLYFLTPEFPSKYSSFLTASLAGLLLITIAVSSL